MVKNNGLAAVAYLAGLITGIPVFLVSEQKDKYVRFHAIQSIFFCIMAIVVGIILGLLAIPLGLTPWALGMVYSSIWIAYGMVLVVYIILVVLIWLYLMINAYAGKKYKLPLIGNMAENISG